MCPGVCLPPGTPRALPKGFPLRIPGNQGKDWFRERLSTTVFFLPSEVASQHHRFVNGSFASHLGVLCSGN